MSARNEQDADAGEESASGEAGLPAPREGAGLPLPNREGSTIGEGRDEETDAVGKGPRDPLVDGEPAGNSASRD